MSIATRLEQVQSYMSSLKYNHTGTQFFEIKKARYVYLDSWVGKSVRVCVCVCVCVRVQARVAHTVCIGVWENSSCARNVALSQPTFNQESDFHQL